MSRTHKILIIEEDKFLIKLYGDKLRRTGFKVVEAISSEEGLNKLSFDKPDLVILDLVLPRKSGFEILSEMKLNPKTKNIPVIIITNLEQESDMKRGLGLGAAAYLLKTELSMEQLPELIKEYLVKERRKKTEVISVVSHRLKNPLSVIKGYLEVLLLEDLGKLTSMQKDYLKDVLENTKQMINLVRDLLDVARIEMRRMELKKEPTDLAEIVAKTIQEFSSLSRAKNCSLSFEVSEEIPLLNIDPLKIKQVVANIISNAIEYNERRGRVEVSLKRKQNNVLFCCKDTGIGIFSNEKKKIFTKFYRSEKAVTHTTMGSGLGLFISKAIIEKSGGKIWFESKENEGSSFYFTLPVK